MDDVIAYNDRVAEHVPQLAKVFQAHRVADIKLKPKKSLLFHKEIDYLGHRLSEQGVGMIPGYIERIRDWPSPKTVAELNSLLGFFGYYRSFIRCYAEMTADMNSQKKLKTLSWTEEMEKELQALKQEFEDAPIRAVPVFDSDQPFQLTTDYSLKAVSAILSQVQDGQEMLIAAMGRKTMDAERRYPPGRGKRRRLFLESRGITTSCRIKSLLSTRIHQH